MAKWILPLLILLLAALGVWYFLKGTQGEYKPVPTTVKPADIPAPSAAPAKESLKVTLPNGKELDAFKGGIEDQLVKFLSDPNSKAGKDVWFDFDNLNFRFGTAEILPESRPQLANIVAILEAFPNAKVKVGGYTDKTGDTAANMKLSQERADTVFADLSRAGVGAQLVGAEGYGSQFAVYPADAPDADRVKDRRVSLSVREK